MKIVSYVILNVTGAMPPEKSKAHKKID